MSILNVNTIQPIGSGTTVTVAATELKTSNFITVGTGASVTSPSANVLTLGTNSAERLRITSAGSVAIGVNSPSDKLHVGGNNAFIRVDRPNGNPGLTLIYNSTNSTRADIDVTTGGDLRFATNSSTERLRITSGGNVGVNVTNPLSDLQVITAGQTEDGTFRVGGSAASLGLVLDYDQSGATVSKITANPTYTNTSSLLKICVDGDGNPNQLVLKGDGKIGFNANPPRDYCFHSGQADTNIQITNNTTGVDDSAGSLIQQDGNDFYIWNKENSFMSLGTNAAERVRISSAGDATFKYKVTIGASYAGGEILSLGKSSGTSYVTFHSGGTSMGFIGYANQLIAGGGSNDLGIRSQDEIRFATGGNTERMRLSANGEHMVYSNGTVSALRTAASSSGSAEILYCTRNSSSVTVGTGVYAIYSNGSASSLSDRTQKKNIETTRDGYLEDLNRLRVVKYNWNDQEDGTPKELGLIAQEVEEVFPGLISNMRSDVGIGTTASTKGVKTSVLPYMLLKALQEANAEIVALKARVNTLEGS